jgi:cytochrome c-type biogenesis protein CcmH
MRLRLALATVAAAVFCLGAASDPAERLANPAKEAHARDLFKEVRCVVCQSESIDDSDADLAKDLRRLVREQVAAGRSDAQIRDFLVARYGEFVLLKPRFSISHALLWFGPGLLLVLGGAGLLWRVRRPPPPEAEVPLTLEEQARLDALLATQDSVTVSPQGGSRNTGSVT